jgi:hypothetical protein
MARIPYKGIVISTSEHTKDWLSECVESMGHDIDVLIVGNDNYEPPINGPRQSYMVNNWNGFELGAILRGSQVFDEFIYFPDTVVVKNTDALKEILKHDGSMILSPNFLSYIGKYESAIIKSIGIPKITTKLEAVDNEFSWTQKYMENCPDIAIFRDLIPVDTGVIKEKNGRDNMVNECWWAVKYKGTWSRDMIK